MRFAWLFLVFGLIACSSSHKASAEEGLKSTDYGSNTIEQPKTNDAPSTPSMTPEQMKLMMDTVNKAKAAQEAQRKALEELENEE